MENLSLSNFSGASQQWSRTTVQRHKNHCFNRSMALSPLNPSCSRKIIFAVSRPWRNGWSWSTPPVSLFCKFFDGLAIKPNQLRLSVLHEVPLINLHAMEAIDTVPFEMEKHRKLSPLKCQTQYKVTLFVSERTVGSLAPPSKRRIARKFDGTLGFSTLPAYRLSLSCCWQPSFFLLHGTNYRPVTSPQITPTLLIRFGARMHRDTVSYFNLE